MDEGIGMLAVPKDDIEALRIMDPKDPLCTVQQWWHPGDQTAENCMQLLLLLLLLLTPYALIHLKVIWSIIIDGGSGENTGPKYQKKEREREGAKDVIRWMSSSVIVSCLQSISSNNSSSRGRAASEMHCVELKASH